MFVALSEVQPNTHAHQTAGHNQLNGDGFSQSQNSNDRAQERGGREIGAGARRTEMPKRDDEQREADAVAEKTDHTGQQSIRHGRQRPSSPQSKYDADRPGNQSLEFDNLQGIGQRYFARQIVVEAPHDARSR